MNELIPDKQAYQVNKRRMAWTALGMMIVSTIAVLIDPARMAEADAVLMMMYGSLSLAAKYYTDPEVFKLETNGLLARTWQFAGHASQLTETGDYFTFDMAGESLFCIKGARW